MNKCEMIGFCKRKHKDDCKYFKLSNEKCYWQWDHHCTNKQAQVEAAKKFIEENEE